LRKDPFQDDGGCHADVERIHAVERINLRKWGGGIDIRERGMRGSEATMRL
jgi:hypothetical protein